MLILVAFGHSCLSPFLVPFPGLLKAKEVSFYKIILFGSYASGTPRRDSDIDIAVVSGDFGKDRFKERVLLSKIAYYVDVRIEPHPVSLKDFKEDTWQVLLYELKSKGIEIAAYQLILLFFFSVPFFLPVFSVSGWSPSDGFLI
jgi:predicted nucleotidyltransferase